MQTSVQPAALLRPLLSDLVRWDNSFSSAWGTSPSPTYIARFDELQGRVLRAAEALRTSQYGELRPVGALLERDAAYMTSLSTRLAGMSARGTTFGAGWHRVLDQSISDVRYGLQLLGVDPHPAPYPPGQPGPGPYPTPSPYPPHQPHPYPPQYPSHPGDGGWGGPAPYALGAA